VLDPPSASTNWVLRGDGPRGSWLFGMDGKVCLETIEPVCTSSVEVSINGRNDYNYLVHMKVKTENRLEKYNDCPPYGFSPHFHFL
jgi:hypothetical protein